MDPDDLFNSEVLTEVAQNATMIAQVVKALIPVGRQVAKEVQPVVSEVLTEVSRQFLVTYAEAQENLKPEAERLSTLRAENRARDFKNYKQQGFSRAEAFALVLASVKPVEFSKALSSIPTSKTTTDRKTTSHRSPES